MSTLIVGSILLQSSVGNDKNEFCIQVVRDPTSSASKIIYTMQGTTGSFTKLKKFGIYTLFNLEGLLKDKVAKGYEIIRVNEKPFVSGDMNDAMSLVDNGNDWSAAKTSQPNRKLKAREVSVTFDVGQLAPIW